MAKKPVVSFYRGDAPKPTRQPTGLVSLKAPFAFTLKKNESRHFDLGLSCSHALAIVSGRVKVVNAEIVPPGSKLVVDISNTTEEDQMFELGDTVVYCAPLGTSEFEVA